MHILGVATRAIFISVLPLEMGVGGIGGPSAWAVIFLSSLNVVGGVPFLVEKVVLPLLPLSSRRVLGLIPHLRTPVSLC